MKLRNYNTAPPGNWRFTHQEPESHGYTSTGITFGQLYKNVQQHRQNMDYPAKDMSLIIEESICQSLEPADQREWCLDAPAPEWPLVLQPLKLLAKPEDTGLGDIVARTIGPIGGDAFKSWYAGVFGGDCGCGRRANRLNRLYPL